jgi:hypothetical protein
MPQTYTKTYKINLLYNAGGVMRYESDGTYGSIDNSQVRSGRSNTDYTYDGFMLFTNVDIPKGSVISSAYLRLKGLWNTSSDLYSEIRINDDEMPTAPYDTYDYIATKVLNSNKVTWNLTSLTMGTWYISPYITSLIQSIIDKSWWVDGKNLYLFLDDAVSSVGTYYGFYAYDSANPTYAPELVVNFTVPDLAPAVPGTFTNPTGILQGGSQITAVWGTSSDANNNLLGYKISYSIDGGTYSTEINCPSNVYSMTVPMNSTIRFRTRAYDSTGLYSGYTYSSVFTITSKTQIGTFPLMGKHSIINIPLYDPNVGMNGKNMYRAFTASGKVGCFEVQDITGNELIRMIGKTKIRGIKR